MILFTYCDVGWLENEMMRFGGTAYFMQSWDVLVIVTEWCWGREDSAGAKGMYEAFPYIHKQSNKQTNHIMGLHFCILD